MISNQFTLTANAHNQREHQERCEYEDAGMIYSLTRLSRIYSTLVESFKAQLCQVASLAGVTTWGFTGTNQAAVTEFHALHLRGMNASRVIPARSWSSPSADDLSVGLNSHAVLSFDTFHSIPTECVSSEGVYDCDSLVKIDDARMNKEEIGTPHNEGAPEGGVDALQKISSSDGCANESTDNKSRDRDRDIDSSRTVDHGVAATNHVHIFSRHDASEGLSA